MREATAAQLERMTGHTYRTIKKRLDGFEPCRKTGVEVYYLLRDALPLIYARPDQDILDLTQQRARLARAQADKVELEIEKMRGNLVDVAVWGEEFSQVLISLKDKLRNMALKIADQLSQCSTAEAAYIIVNRYATEVLDEIATSSQHRSQDAE